MKGKPPSKKVKLEPPSSSDTGRVSPALSTTSSSASSLLSIPPPTSGGSKAGTDLVSVAKAVVKPSGGGGGKASASSSSSSAPTPTWPIYSHPDLKEGTSRLSILLNTPKGSGANELILGPEGILSVEDLDALQTELETLWSATAVRIRSLKVDQVALQNCTAGVVNTVVSSLGEHYDPHHQEKLNAVASLLDAGHGTRTSVSAAAKLVMGNQIGVGKPGSSLPSSSTPATKKMSAAAAASAKMDKQPKKKCKGDGAGGLGKGKGGEKPARATQNRTHSISSDLGTLDGFYKHEAPNEFWDFADKYCSEVTEEHLEDLEKIIEDHSSSLNESLFEVPPLGKHFKEKDGTNAKEMNAETSRTRSADSLGPLTQRLVAALVDERVAMYNNQKNPASPKEDASTGNGEIGSFIHRAGLIKALGLDGGGGSSLNNNNKLMESQLRECLLDRGFLSPEDANDLTDPDDEILVEIRRTQNTLKKLHNYNYEKLMDLKTKVKREIDRTPLKAELDQADKELVEAYKAIAALRQKRKPVTKKEKDAAVKALEQRDKVLQNLSPQVGNNATLHNHVHPTESSTEGSLKVEV